jgi:hypothetical protein
MKTKLAHVTNSSSTSYICAVSGEVVSGWDLVESDAGFLHCLAGHEFLEGYRLDLEIGDEEYVDEVATYFERQPYDYAQRYAKEIRAGGYDVARNYAEGSISTKQCPICTMEHIRDENLLAFVLYAYGIDREDAENAMRAHGTLSAALEAIKGT